MTTRRPPNLYYYASGNKNVEGSSIEEGSSNNNVFYPNGAVIVPPSSVARYSNGYSLDPRMDYGNKSDEGSCGKSVSPILAMLFVLFFVAFLATLIVWSIMTNGFRDMGRIETNSTSIGPAQVQPQQILNENECQTEDCVHVASQMLTYIDRSINPCEDFYRFACGNYANSVLMPEDKRRVSPLDEMDTKLNMQLKSILEKRISSGNSKSAKLARTFYRSCMNVEQLSAQGLEPLKKLISQLGDWPLFQPAQWQEQNFQWETLDAKIRRKLGVESVISLFLLEDSKDSTKRIITIDQPNLNLGSRDYYLKGKRMATVKAYYQYMIDSVVMLGALETEAQRYMLDVLDLEIMLANISTPEEDRRDKMYNPITIGDLKREVPEIKWDEWLRLSFPNHLNVTDNERVNVVGMNYLKQLPSVLHLVNRSTIANYQIWNIIVSAVDFLPSELREAYRKFQQSFIGIKAEMPRWEECVTSTASFLPWPVGSMFVGHFFQKNAKQEMEVLVANLRHAMREQLRTNEWMDQDTRRSALLKLSKMIQKIGYPDYIHNETKILEDVEGIDELSEEDYLNNALQINGIRIEKNLHKLRLIVDKSDWFTQPAMVNAFYSSSANEIIFPAGILQFPAFALNAPKYVTYSRIGAAIGHEIIHGYDDEGRQYDHDGNVKDWWSAETSEKFKEHSDCFVSQYDNVTEPTTGKRINGKLTLGENIADNSGLKIAYKAYQIWTQQNGNITESNLPGFSNYGPNKMFFLAYASLWCENIRAQSVDVVLTVDPHTLANYRINIPLQNFPSFSEAWNCSSTSRMNPVKKCSIL